MGDRAARLAHQVVVLVLVRRLEDCTARAEIGPPDESLLDEHVERAVDGRRVDLRKPLLNLVRDLLGAQVEVRLGGQHVPDRRTLDGQALASLPQDGRGRQVVVMAVLAHSAE